jgi:hypothetical protein
LSTLLTPSANMSALQRNDIGIEPLESHLEDPAQAQMAERLAFEGADHHGMATSVELTSDATAGVAGMGRAGAALAALGNRNISRLA